MISEKKCEGKDKAIGFKEACGTITHVSRLKYGLCPKCLFEFYTTTDAGRVLYYKSFLPKVKATTVKNQKEADKETRLKLKTLSQYEADAKKSFQKFIRLRDADLGCISCPSITNDLWDGGHYKKAELYSGVIFDETNCHKQCRKCNRFLGGNELNYRQGLIARYGEAYVNTIEQKASDTRNYKYTKDELIQLKKLYDEKIKSFK